MDIMACRIPKLRLNEEAPREIYIKYFYNKDSTLKYVLSQMRNGLPIDDSNFDYVFDVDPKYMDFVQDLVLYYPKKLKEIGRLNNHDLVDLKGKYGETIDILKEYKENKTSKSTLTPRSRMRNSIGKKNPNLIAEDILLTRKCPVTGIELCYTNPEVGFDSPTIGLRNPDGDYVIGNFQVVAYQTKGLSMKNSEHQKVKQRKLHIRTKPKKAFKCECGETNPNMFYRSRKYACKNCVNTYRDKNSLEKEVYIQKYRDWVGNNLIKFRVTSARIRSKKMGLEFDIDSDFVEGLLEKQKGRCYYSGVKMDLSNKKTDKNKNYNSLSIDRLDSSKGYTKDNINLVCAGVNTMKMDMDETEFLSLIKSIYNNSVISV